LSGLSWLVFELTNVWSFNADSIPALRAIFAILVISAAGLFLFSRWRLLPAALLLAVFVVTTALSNAVVTVPYLVSAGAVVLLVGWVSRKFGPPLNVRKPPLADARLSPVPRSHNPEHYSAKQPKCRDLEDGLCCQEPAIRSPNAVDHRRPSPHTFLCRTRRKERDDRPRESRDDGPDNRATY
ncbi:MAG TPA: hypothetical protein VE567_00950, partial [Sphingomonas sp.]|nr:hypothetical protein [Sphingomonas sp.]